jgi:hypothetical protein
LAVKLRTQRNVWRSGRLGRIFESEQRGTLGSLGMWRSGCRRRPR